MLSPEILSDALIAATDAADVEHALEMLVESLCRQSGWLGGHALIPAAAPLPPFVPAASWYRSDALIPLAEIESGDWLTAIVGDTAVSIDLEARAGESPRGVHARAAGVRAVLVVPVRGDQGLSVVLEFLLREPIVLDCAGVIECDRLARAVAALRQHHSRLSQEGSAMRIASLERVRRGGLEVVSMMRDLDEQKRREVELMEEARLLTGIVETQHAVGTAALEPAVVMRTACESAQLLVRADMAAIGLLQDDEIRIRHVAGSATDWEKLRIPLAGSLPGRALIENRILSSSDWASDVRDSTNQWKRLGLRSGIFVPIGDGVTTTGVLIVGYTALDAFSDRDLATLELVAGLLSAAISRANELATHRRLLDERTAALTALSETEARFAAFMDNTPIVAMLKDQNGRVVWANAQCERQLGKSLDELRGRIGFDLLPSDRAIERGATDLDAQSVGTLVEVRRTMSGVDGRSEFWQTYKFPIVDARGRQLVGLVGLDVTARQRLEQQLLQAQKLEAIGQLAAGIAHEINTPTQYVSDNVRFLGQAFLAVFGQLHRTTLVIEAARSHDALQALVADADAGAREADIEYLQVEVPLAVQQTIEGLERIGEIVRSVKSFSHPDIGAMTPVDLNREVENTIVLSRNEWKYVAEVVTCLDRELTAVTCRVSELNQVVLNIVVNAAHTIGEKMERTGGDRGRITVGTRRVLDTVEIWVTDTGDGIPDAMRSRIFDPFFTTKDPGKGTGQGLAIAHSIIEKHGGAIRVDTEIGVGTTFTICIPIDGGSQTSTDHERPEAA